MTYLMSDSSTLQHEVDSLLTQYADAKFAGFNLLLLTPTVHVAHMHSEFQHDRAVDSSGTRIRSSGPERPREQTGTEKVTYTYDGAIVTNSGGGGRITARLLSDEEKTCGGVSNGIGRQVQGGGDGADAVLQGAAEWPKVEHGRAALREILYDSEGTNANKAGDESQGTTEERESELVERLFDLLTCVSLSPYCTAPARLIHARTESKSKLNRLWTSSIHPTPPSVRSVTCWFLIHQ